MGGRSSMSRNKGEQSHAKSSWWKYTDDDGSHCLVYCGSISKIPNVKIEGMGGGRLPMSRTRMNNLIMLKVPKEHKDTKRSQKK
ncbi:hypothetical protein AVEN_76520-1 [Araneus ventricosus]|uniref:Uncharacterized protein n=1 Tax=Araneus ventricosus TaxID=182803 RepID=A0A4Y2CFB3_ARAVE|nr:hypothetical protein AVEN_76520-1 [Araneus ventricosus]